jgi:hypothetical protein
MLVILKIAIAIPLTLLVIGSFWLLGVLVTLYL